MLHIPNSAEGNCLTEKENHTLFLQSDIKSINLQITKIIVVKTAPRQNTSLTVRMRTIQTFIVTFIV